MYIIGFGEIFTKGDNKNYFTSVLIKNVRKALNLEQSQIIDLHNRYILLTENAENLKYIFGLSFYSKVIQTDFNNLKETALSFVKKEYTLENSKNFRGAKDSEESFSTFKIHTKRITKDYKPSPEVNVEVADYILRNKKIKVNLDNPELEIFIEIINNNAYIYTNKTKHIGLQGLPVGTAGNIYLDYKNQQTGTVAAYFLMKRGCNIILPKPIPFLNKFNIDNNIKQAYTKSEFVASDTTLQQLSRSNKLKIKSETIFYPLISFTDKQIKEMYNKIKEL